MSTVPILDTHIYHGMDMQVADLQTVATGVAAAFSMRALDREGDNEDAAALFCVQAEAGVLLVADGVGGMPTGELAARLAIGEFERSLTGAVEDRTRLRSGILNGFEAANRVICEDGAGSGTTLVVLEIDGTVVRPYHVGDSALLVVGQRGRVKWQTIAHSPVGHAIESGLLDEAEALHHEDRNLISNMVGSAEMRIEIGPSLAMAKRDTVLLATDGLFDNLRIDEIVECIRCGPMTIAAAKLAEQCRLRMQAPSEGNPCKPDDVTFVLFRRR